MRDQELLHAVRDAVSRFRLTDIELAALSGISVPIARDARRGNPPKTSRCLNGLTAWD